MGSIVIDEKYDNCRKKLRENISGKRYLHSVGVSNTSACLAMRYGIECKRAYLAGLLHDCAKGLSGRKLLEIVSSAGLHVSETEADNPDLLHSKAGSIIAREEYSIDDEEMLGAIYCHTTGKPGMTDLEKIVFIADYIEPNRTGLPGLEGIRKAAFDDMDKAIVMICENTLQYLKSSPKSIDPATLETYRYYREISDSKTDHKG